MAADHLKSFDPAAMSDADQDAYGRLLNAWAGRKRALGKSEAMHPKTLERVVRRMDASGQHEGADAIQSLVWMHQLMERRVYFFMEQLREAEAERNQARELVEHLTEILARVVKHGQAWLKADPHNEYFRRRQVQAMVETAESALERSDAT